MTKLGAIRILDREKWITLVTKAMKRAEGNRHSAAKLLGVSWRQLCRWLEDPDLADVVRAGPGRPKGKVVKKS